MNVRIESDFRFSVAAIQYTPQGELCITLSSAIALRLPVKQNLFTARGIIAERPMPVKSFFLSPCDV